MSTKTVLSGKLAFLGLPDVFQILGSAKATGLLRITSQFNPDAARIYFMEGNPVNGSNGSLRGLKAVYSLFGWTEGIFEFCEEKVPVDRVIKKSRMEIILDALKMLDDGVIKKVGPPSLLEEAQSEENGLGRDKASFLPVIKGPLPDYLYVIEEEEYRNGEQIVREGGYGKWIWVVLEGEVKITRDTDMGPLTIAMVGEGSFIGTFSSFLFKQNPRTATATTMGEVKLGLLDNERLASEYENLSPEIRKVLISLDRRLKKATDRVVELSVDRDSLKGLTKGKKVFMKMGSVREVLYMINQGEAFVVGKSPKGPLPLLRLETDDFFGSIPFLDHTHEPHSASVLVSEDIKITEFDTASLQREYEEVPGILRNLANHICINIAMTTRLLYRTLHP